MGVAQLIDEKIRAAISVTEIDVIDQSHLHAGHAGAREGGESHFRLRIVSPDFAGKSRVQQQRLINDVLAEELKEQIHALSMELIVAD